MNHQTHELQHGDAQAVAPRAVPAASVPQSAAFDFLAGSWTVRHQRLKQRLAGCAEWESFSGRSHMQQFMQGRVNLDDNVLDLPTGQYRAVTLRSFDPQSGLWAIWWLDGRHPHQLDAPMRGKFCDGVGTFFADDEFDGRPIRVRFLWSHVTPRNCRWEQAFSTDGGATWESNWLMDFTREE